MHIIDRYAYTNLIRAVDPAQKVGLSLAVLAICLVSNEPLVGLAAVVWMWGLAVWLARLSGWTFARVLFAEFLFFVLTTMGVAVSLSFSDPRPLADWAVQAGPVWLSTSRQGLDLAVHLVARALGATAAMNFLALTTPLVDLVELFRRWRVPGLLIDLMTIIYRFIFVLLDSLDRMYMAQDSRLGYHTSFYRTMTSAGLLGSRLFIDAYQRSQRLHTALESRGFEGELRVLPGRYKFDRKTLGASLLVLISLILVWIL
jgi:cobalt/nickel transport system permease protein